MKFFIALTLSITILSQHAVAATAPALGRWKKTLMSENCKANYSFWELQNSNIGLLEIVDESTTQYRAMTLKVMNTDRRIYETNDGLLPSFEIFFRHIIESSWPYMTVYKSGVSYDCMMTHVIDEDSITNVGSIGH